MVANEYPPQKKVPSGRHYGKKLKPVQTPNRLSLKLAYNLYILYTQCIFAIKNMSAISLVSKRRKNIDLSEDTFRALSVLASANGKNLKAYIETILNDEAKMLNEEMIYREFLKDQESQEIVSSEEKESFEKWLGV